MQGGHVVIGPKIVEAAQKSAGAFEGIARQAPVIQWHDLKVTGLVLRLRGGRLSWIVKHRGQSVTLGAAWPLTDRRVIKSAGDARKIAVEIKSVVDLDARQVESWLSAYFGSGRDSKVAVDVMRPYADTWSLQECIDQTIKDKTSKRARESDLISEATEKDIRTTFNRPCWTDALAEPAALLTVADVEKARNWTLENAGTSPAIKAVTYTRSILNWCAKHHAGASGLGKVDRWWQMLSAPYEVKAKTRKPTIKDIVATLVLAEQYLDKPLPGRAIKAAGTKPGTLAGLWWLALTAQRATAGLSLLAHDVVADPEDDTYMIAVWGEDIMKGGRSHALPIPTRAWQHIDGFRGRGRHHRSQDWAFPSERGADKHATTSGVYRILYRLAGRDKVETKGSDKKRARTERRDLLAETGIAWWSPHDPRRTLTDFLGEQGIPGGASVVLAHEIDEREKLAATANDREREDFARLRTARITRMAYGGAQYLALKKEALTLWTDALLDEYDRQKAAASRTA